MTDSQNNSSAAHRAGRKIRTLWMFLGAIGGGFAGHFLGRRVNATTEVIGEAVGIAAGGIGGHLVGKMEAEEIDAQATLARQPTDTQGNQQGHVEKLVKQQLARDPVSL